MSEQAKVLFFATIREKVGMKETIIEFPQGTRISDIKTILRELFPNLDINRGSIIISLNHEFAFDDDVVPDGAEIAIFPPVSGGVDVENKYLTVISIVEDVININKLLAKITTPTTGAACLFTGIVRGITQRGNPHRTEYLEYEAYRQMAEGKMLQISLEIRSRWPDVEGIVIVQRIGKLDPGIPSVLIACTASHRDTGVFEAARYGIDRLKEIVPIWKKEVSPDGEEWVEGEYIPKPGE
jgi:molybdopterin converting factor subunit 1